MRAAVKTDNRNSNIAIWLTDEENKLIRQKAKEAYIPVSTYIRMQVLSKIKEEEERKRW